MLEITQAMGLSKITVYRLLGSLQQMGYVSKNETNARYHLTKKLLCLGLKALGEANLGNCHFLSCRLYGMKLKKALC